MTNELIELYYIVLLYQAGHNYKWLNLLLVHDETIFSSWRYIMQQEKKGQHSRRPWSKFV